jgi:exosortase N
MAQLTKENLLKGLLLISPLVIFWIFNHHNVPLKFSMLLGFIVAPYVLMVREKSVNYRYGILALIVGMLLLVVRSNTLYYFSAIFVLLFVIDNWFGRANSLLLLLGIVISPAINTIVYIWSFPIRLKLSQLASQSLQVLGMNIEAHGNVLWLNGHTFSVDPACIGLKMVTTALVLGVLILGYFEKKYQRNISFFAGCGFLVTILVASVAANFIRLLTLIVFHILPENPLHDVIGMLSLGVYVLLPFYFFVKRSGKRDRLKRLREARYSVKPLEIAIKSRFSELIGRSRFSFRNRLHFFYKKKNTPIKAVQSTAFFKKEKTNHKRGITVLFGVLILLHIYNGIQFLEEPLENRATIENIVIKDLKRTITPTGVLKMEDDSTLIYIKPPVRFFQGSHDPRFCWQGSGYDFSEVEIKEIGSKWVYTAELKKGEEQFYTAWWYESESTQTPHEWNWRWKNMRNQEHFYMINVSCMDENALERWVKDGARLTAHGTR